MNDEFAAAGNETEAAAHAMLRLVADMPGQMGRLRVARVIGGYAVPVSDPELISRLADYRVHVDWSLRDAVELVDTLLDSGLLAQTCGQRPVLVLTRAGYRALDALEALAPAGGACCA